MNEYVIHAKLKNNLLLSRILASHKSVREFCQAHDLSDSEVGNFVNLKQPAVYLAAWHGGEEGEWTIAARRVAAALCMDPSELFSEEQRTVQLKTNEAWIEMSRQQALSMVNPLETIETREVAHRLLENGKLTKRERLVLNSRFGIGCCEMTLEEVGKQLDVTRERVRQIEAKALRKLRSKDAQRGVLPPETKKKSAPLFDPHAAQTGDRLNATQGARES